MKKLLVVLLCVAMIASFSIFADAASEAMLEATPSKTDLARGDRVTVTYSLSGCPDVTTMAIAFDFDENVFEIVSGCWADETAFSAGTNTVKVLVEDFNAEEGRGVITLKVKNASGTDLDVGADCNTELFTLELEALADANLGHTTVDCQLFAKTADNADVEVESAATVFNVETATVVSSELKMSGAGLRLNNGIQMMVNVKPSLVSTSGYSDLYVKVEYITESGTPAVKYLYPETNESGYVIDNEYIRIMMGLAPKELGRTYTFTLCGTKDGVEYVSTSVPYGAYQYCDNMFKNANTPDKTKKLLVALFEYADQDVLFNGGTELPSSRATSLTAENKALYATALRENLSNILNAKYTEISAPKATWKGASLVLADTVDVRYNLVFPAGTDFSNITLKVVRYTGEDTTTPQQTYVIAGDKFVYNEAEGYYSVILDQLTSRYMSDRLLATVYEGDTAISNTASYSIETYVAREITKPAKTALVSALIKYGDAVKAFNA